MEDINRSILLSLKKIIKQVMSNIVDKLEEISSIKVITAV
ncbi:hypothetical protein AB751O23_AF_00020 [Chlamydiales bacterium SCGC AB-751-O23]|nr:hypothetical protein AB751O23_AF_00020 [Chlamydiales bacterium SCGC AB-751-O23]